MNVLLALGASQIQILIRTGIAVVLGASLGLERELADKPAGLRTHMLVSGAAALLVSLGEILVQNFSQQFNAEILNSDPIRIIEAVITGVSFLGAGTIIRSRSDGQVEGLTTAASILFAAALGIAVAVNEFGLALVATAMALVTLRILRWVEGWIKRK
jgi:putative Mg2+ transporter-C (MgtC) family protein